MKVRHVLIAATVAVAIIGGGAGLTVADHANSAQAEQATEQCEAVHEGGEGADNAADQSAVDRAHDECHGDHQQEQANR